MIDRIATVSLIRPVLVLLLTVVISGCPRVLSQKVAAPEPSQKTSVTEEPSSDTSPATAATALPTESVTTPPPISEMDLAGANKRMPITFQVDDAIKFSVWGHPELTHVAVVQPNGHVTLPLVGDVIAVGKSAEELKRELEARFSDGIDTSRVKIHRDDILKMTVWEHPDLTHESTVQMDGNVIFPLVGEIRAAGRTLSDLRTEIQTKLSRYLNRPVVSILPVRLYRGTVANAHISVLPEELRPRQVAVLGEVDQKGVQTIKGSLRVLDALGRAGYRVDTANLNSVVVIRDHNGSAPTYRQLRLEDYLSGKASGQNIYLRTEDIVIVPKTTIAKVGVFVEQFFTRTKPVFDWWLAMQQARYAEDLLRSSVRINELLFAD